MHATSHATSHAFIAFISNNYLFVSWAITPDLELGYKFYISYTSQIKGAIENIESPMHRYLNVLCHKNVLVFLRFPYQYVHLYSYNKCVIFTKSVNFKFCSNLWDSNPRLRAVHV